MALSIDRFKRHTYTAARSAADPSAGPLPQKLGDNIAHGRPRRGRNKSGSKFLQTCLPWVFLVEISSQSFCPNDRYPLTGSSTCSTDASRFHSARQLVSTVATRERDREQSYLRPNHRRRSRSPLARWQSQSCGDPVKLRKMSCDTQQDARSLQRLCSACWDRSRPLDPFHDKSKVFTPHDFHSTCPS